MTDTKACRKSYVSVYLHLGTVTLKTIISSLINALLRMHISVDIFWRIIRDNWQMPDKSIRENFHNYTI
ncbi:MAG TPA: hypothetical protein DCX22_03915 [Dehalococcoidia bacterium]|nr:hypothetical protein [Dehalococcoidia bacterium]